MIVFENGATLETSSIISGKQQVRGQQRPSLKISIPSNAKVTYADGTVGAITYDFLKEYFADGVSITIRELVPTVDNETGGIIDQINDYPHPQYCLAGPIIDNADDTWTVSICQKTQNEIIEEENAELLFALLDEGVSE